MPEASANTSTAVIVRLRSWADAKGWSKSRFAREAGLVDTTLRHFYGDHWNPTREVLERLEAVIPAGWQAGDPVPSPSGQAARGPEDMSGSESRAPGDEARDEARPLAAGADVQPRNRAA